MDVLRAAFIFVAPEADPAVNRVWVKTPKVHLLTVGVADYAQAEAVAKELVAKDGIAAIALCGGFGNTGTALARGNRACPRAASGTRMERRALPAHFAEDLAKGHQAQELLPFQHHGEPAVGLDHGVQHQMEGIRRRDLGDVAPGGLGRLTSHTAAAGQTVGVLEVVVAQALAKAGVQGAVV